MTIIETIRSLRAHWQLERIRSAGERSLAKRYPNRKIGPESFSPVERHFQFVVVSIDDSNAERIPSIQGKTVSAILKRKGMCSDLSSTLVVGFLGVSLLNFPEAAPPNDTVEARTELVTALLAENGNAVRIAHGQCTAIIGFLAKRHSTYDAMIPGYAEILKRLLNLQFGSAIEI